MVKQYGRLFEFIRGNSGKNFEQLAEGFKDLGNEAVDELTKALVRSSQKASGFGRGTSRHNLWRIWQLLAGLYYLFTFTSKI